MPTQQLNEITSISKKWLVSLEPDGPDSRTIQTAKMQLMAQPTVKNQTAGNKSRLLSFKVVEDPKTDRTQGHLFNSFEAVIYNYTQNRAISVKGSVDFSGELTIKDLPVQPPYSAEEINHARDIAAANPIIKKMLADQKAVLLPAMPAQEFSNHAHQPEERIVSLLVQPVHTSEAAQIIGVNLNRDELIRPVVSIQPRSELVNNLIHPVNLLWPLQLETNSNEHVWFTIKDASTQVELWKMLVIRPQASAGPVGSGLELKYVSYKGKRVLFQAHAPIWNVLYKGVAVTYRDWTNQESGFNATGIPFKDANGNNLSNFILCSAPPATVFETGADGPFKGVAFYENADGSWTLSTMMQAGWYRYYMAYTFSADGTIRPRVGFTTNGSNPYAQYTHVHHAYYRFDFDIESSSGDLVKENTVKLIQIPTPPFIKITNVSNPVLQEKKMFRSALLASYSVVDKATNKGYRVTPGSHDGTASGDDFAKGDVWALAYNAGELYDNPPANVTSAELDKFLSNQSIDGADLVLWYGVHFSHDPNHTHGEKDFGPDLLPLING